MVSYPSESAIEALALRATQPGPIGRDVAASILEELGQGGQIDQVARALLELAEGKKCQEKRAAVVTLRDHPELRSLPALKRLGRGGLARWFQNRCLREPLQQAIAAIEALPAEG